jgi:hypothetical protein
MKRRTMIMCLGISDRSLKVKMIRRMKASMRRSLK